MSGIPPSKTGDLSFTERWRRSQNEAVPVRADDMSDTTNPDGAAPPVRCPACRSQDVKTTSKVVSAETYWRCGDCGEVWNVARHRAGSRYARDLPFRR